MISEKIYYAVLNLRKYCQKNICDVFKIIKQLNVHSLMIRCYEFKFCEKLSTMQCYFPT